MASTKRQQDNREYYLKNKDSIKTKSSLYYLENKEKVLRRLTKKHKENPELMRERVKNYYQNNPEYRKSRKKDSRRWVERNPEKRRIYTRNSHIRAYGISPERYKEMLKEQGNRCAICKMENKRVMAIDHDHKTGKVRGFLCDPCNLSLGHIEKQDFLEKAIKYITKYK